MPSRSESGFGPRLKSAQDLTVIMTQYNITPSRPEDSITELQILCTTIANKNDSLASAIVNYNTANKQREEAFSGKTETSAIGMLTYIRKYIDSSYGKESLQSKQVATLIKDMRSKKPAIGKVKEDGTISFISQSEQSYGALNNKFSALVSVLAGFQGYDPPVAHLKLPALQAFTTALDSYNQNTMTTETVLRNLQEERTTLYTDLHQRCLRIKAHILLTQGKSSNAYNMTKGMKF